MAQRVLVLGATGTAGRAAAQALVAAGHSVTCFGRRDPHIPGTRVRIGDVEDAGSIARDGFTDGYFDTVVSCLASRTGAPEDAWAIDHRAHLLLLDAALDTGVRHFVYLSAICVQKPRLAFQHAKLAFEDTLAGSGLRYSIVRPTAYFKSLSGQVNRLRAGKPFLLFGDGALTACKPISDGDLGDYIAGCLDDPDRQNRILPIGGPGPALTPRAQGEALFAALDLTPKFRHVPVRLLDGIRTGLRVGGWVSPKLAAKAELAEIGRYYATESMLLWNPEQNQYDADATPETGSDTLPAFYQRLAVGAETVQLGAHAVF